MQKRRTFGVRRLILYLAILVVCAFVLFPFLWMLSVSLKPETETYSRPPTWIPENPTAENYLLIWTVWPFGAYFRNSLFVALGTTFIATSLAALAAYGFSRFKIRGSDLMFSSILITQMFPGVLLVIPYFILMNSIGLLNTHLGLILAYVSFALPFSVWLLRSFFDGIPLDLDDAALIDGCSRFSSFRLIILPLAMPGVSVTCIFNFLLGWSEFLFALVLVSHPSKYLITVGINALIGQYYVAWNEFMAMGIISIVPVLVLFMFLQRHLIQGLTAGAVKS